MSDSKSSKKQKSKEKKSEKKSEKKLKDKSIKKPDKGPWYRDGLRFECTQCGACCSGEPGYVWVDDSEVAAMAEEIGITMEAFERKFVRQVGRDRSLIE